jgi:hypothetical protein
MRGTFRATVSAIASRPRPPIPATRMWAMLMTSVDLGSRSNGLEEEIRSPRRRKKTNASARPQSSPGTTIRITGSMPASGPSLALADPCGGPVLRCSSVAPSGKETRKTEGRRTRNDLQKRRHAEIRFGCDRTPAHRRWWGDSRSGTQPLNVSCSADAAALARRTMAGPLSAVVWCRWPVSSP